MTAESIRDLLIASPVYISYVVGIITAIVFLRLSTKPAALVITGCSVFLTLSICSPLVAEQIANSINEKRITQSAGDMQMLVFRLVHALFAATGVCLLLAAAFSGRSTLEKDVLSLSHTNEAPHELPAPHRGILIFTLGALGLLLCFPVGLIAWFLSVTDVARMRAGRMDPSGEALTIAGQLLGVVGTVLSCIAITLAILVRAGF